VTPKTKKQGTNVVFIYKIFGSVADEVSFLVMSKICELNMLTINQFERLKMDTSMKNFVVTDIYL
jgi:hypothetical protein